ncbi:MAG: protein-methionine-sulfoxide reductase catalytic subunit MsrP [Candidatus Aminicenantes bacterium]|nr:protein-methionine-sulfoxide reductase catalytic subunit MsrP [Candidatus Aminicenantes bacterium]MDH5385746.1 protein-methionine-sulfoxide reductase catalytic subunit MsrP [Candidatus Aminicenantes bacterium]MDH5743062.1 protein-methionine-sulfoxide reductase catalytic subunit MsrP [Candidatus Aminicenantes bacterium]
MLVKKAPDIKSSEITPKKLYMDRRKFIVSSAAVAGMGLIKPDSLFSLQEQQETKLKISKKGEYTVAEKLTSYEEATGYTNYYEFSTSKREPTKLAKDFKTRPWTVSIEGEVKEPLKFDIDEIINMFPLEERIYRWRCVEAWGMIIPWIGFPLAGFIKKCEPTSKAKFVEFTTIYDPDQMPGQKTKALDWPYTEGLRMDEAMHPLTLLGVGMYGEILPNQNGAPLRMVIPWKYGFKSGKSIVRIRFLEKMPKTTWNKQRPEEYGFYANVNPNVNHPRWTQKTERRIGESGRRKTLMFNGYEEEVGSLYSSMDLKKHY